MYLIGQKQKHCSRTGVLNLYSFIYSLANFIGRIYPQMFLYSFTSTNAYCIGSQSAPYGAPGIRERTLAAPRDICLLLFISNRKVLWGSANSGESLLELYNTKRWRSPPGIKLRFRQSL